MTYRGIKIGLALGSGSARGWSHIGVIKELQNLGIQPDIVCGSSIGAIVGAAYVNNNLSQLEEWVTSLTRLQVATFLSVNLSLNGFVNRERLSHFLSKHVCDPAQEIQHLPKKFACVATELVSGREIWITKGAVLDAVWASTALPGLFPPVRSQGAWLVDGGLVNPVPVSVCRALGAEVVIAVNLNGDILGRHFEKREIVVEQQEDNIVSKLLDKAKGYSALFFEEDRPEDVPPSLFEAVASSINITQDRITRSRMAGDPPEILLSPKLSKIGLLEFYRAGEAIAEGHECVTRLRSEIESVLGPLPADSD